MNNLDDRRYIAISVKHSKCINDLVLWGTRTTDDEDRCFSGYSDFSRNKGKKCELYSLRDFQDHYGNGVIKCDEPVRLTRGFLNIYKSYDTVMVDEEEYKKYFNL